MPQKVILISGRICTWKTHLSSKLEQRRGFHHLRTRDRLREVAAHRQLPQDRMSLQALGDALDKETGFSWVYDFVNEALADNATGRPIVVEL